MDAARYAQVKELAGELLAASAAERAVRLEPLDAELRREVETLLAAHDQASGFLDRPAFETVTLAANPALPPGRHLGRYRILREIGAGGMGMVYEAVRDDEIRKRVALKVVKPGMDTGAILKRFEDERRIGAALNHPNIVTLLDGGSSEEGRPWFAMEFVEGSRIDEYCASRELPLRQRLELFRVVCAAVHYAHQNLVVHRDLKPSNILVTKEGVPKLLDFGIAKLLSPFETGDTLTAGLPVMTPDYASPEQARAAAITTATDVYSLGAVLYELLTGARPHRFGTRSPSEIVEVICEQPTVAPSQASGRRELAGDVDNIILKAMQKEPARRYASADELSQDIERYLTGMPVRARQDTFSYHAGKFLKRHRAGVAAAALLVLTLAAGIIATAWQARIAAQERDRAQRRFAEVRKLANTVLWDLADKLPNMAGNRDFRREMLGTGVHLLDTLSQEAGSDSTLNRELARGYQRAGDAVRNTATGVAPDIPAAQANYRKALAFAERIHRTDDEWDDAQNVAISAAAALGSLTKDRQRLQAVLTNARARYANTANVDRARVLATVEQAAAMNPMEGLGRALAVVEKAYRAHPNDTGAQRLYFNWAAASTVRLLFPEPKTCWKYFEAAEPIGRGLVAADKRDQQTAYAFANGLSAAGYSRALSGSDGMSRARQQLLESIAVFGKFAPHDPTDYDYRAYSAMARMGLSYVETESGNHRAAIQAALEGLEIMKPFTGTRFESSSYRLAMGGLHVHAARACHLTGQVARACGHYREADRFYGRPKSAGVPPFLVALIRMTEEGRTRCGIP